MPHEGGTNLVGVDLCTGDQRDCWTVLPIDWALTVFIGVPFERPFLVWSLATRFALLEGPPSS